MPDSSTSTSVTGPDGRLSSCHCFPRPAITEVQSIEVLTPYGELLVELDLERYRTIKGRRKPDKRVFIRQLDVPPDAANGWYTARTSTGQWRGTRRTGLRDPAHPAPGSAARCRPRGRTSGIPEKLSWEPVPGANFYQVFIRDLWNEDKLIHTSKLVTRPELELPPGLLQHGGYYSWVVHARDTNNHILLGDFNHGSLNKPVSFSVQ